MVQNKVAEVFYGPQCICPILSQHRQSTVAKSIKTKPCNMTCRWTY